MKAIKKFGSLLIAAVMMMAMTITAFAADTGTITISDVTKGNTYKVYKVFEAVGNGTNISYKLVDGKTNAPAGFTVDAAGNVTYNGTGTDKQLTADDIVAIAAYVTESDLVGTQVAEASDSIVFSGLSNGYYYITTTTGTAVTITSTNPDAKVKDKNEAPVLDKKVTGIGDGSLDADGKKALAEVGTTVTYTATIDVKTGAVGYVFHDVMSDGLSYNNDVSVKVGDSAITASNSTYSTALAERDTITLTFNDAWIKEQVGKTISITYTATVTSDALTTNPAKNTASIDYGNGQNINSTPESVVELYNAQFTVTKEDGNNKALAGAGFVLTKTVAVEGEQAKIVYYKENGNGNDISWVEDIEEATELSTKEGNNIVTFTGLADGNYTLIEKTVPAGYNKAENYNFTIKAGDYSSTNLKQQTTVINNAGTELPSTGGMGTTIFYVLGSLLVICAGVVLIARKRMSAMK